MDDDPIELALRQKAAPVGASGADPIEQALSYGAAANGAQSGAIEPLRPGAAISATTETPSAWRQWLQRTANNPESGGLIGELTRGGAEAVGSAATHFPGALASSAGGFISGLGSPEQFDSPNMRNVGAVLSRIGAAITPGHWSEPTTAVGSVPATVSNAIGEALKLSGTGYQKMGELAGYPRTGAIVGNVVSNFPLLAGAAKTAEAGLGAARSAISGPAISQGAQGVTAAGGTNLRTTPLPDVSQATPETQAAVQLAQSRGMPIHPDVLARHLEAESLPIPGKLTEGQGKAGIVPGGLDILSKEWNLRGQNDLADKFNGQNQTILDNFGAIKEGAAPNVSATTPAQTGQGLIDAYLRKDAPVNAAIDSKWDAIRQTSNNAPIFDAPTLVQNIQEGLRQKMLSTQDPGGQFSQLIDLARRGGMTPDQFVNMRLNLGQVARQGGIEGKAASTMIDELNKAPMEGQNANIRSMVSDALQMGRARHAALEADPAYKAAVNGTVAPDDFVHKFVINGNDADVALMRRNLDALGQQHMAAGAMDYLSGRAGVLNGAGNVSQAGLNRALYGSNGIAPKLNSIFDPKSAQDVESLAGFARNSQQQPRGSYINNSNTFTAAAAHGLAEAGAVALGVPPGAVTMAREMLQRRAAKKAGEQAVGPRRITGE